jgi:hypothetical protein
LRRLQQLHFKHGEKLHSWSTMYMRLITDPATLQAYRRDMRQFFYVSLDGAAKGVLLGADLSIIDRSPAVSDASNARAVEGLRIGGADALSGQCQLGIGQAQCESVAVVDDKRDGRLRRGAYREAPVILFQEVFGCFSQSFDHQASIFVEDAVGSAVLRE